MSSLAASARIPTIRSMKHLPLPLLLLALLLGGLTGCASNSDIISAGLRIELTQIQRGADGSVQVTWRVQNPNVVAYVFQRSTHKLTLDGVEVGTMQDSSPTGVPPRSQADRTGTLIPAGSAGSQTIDQALARGSASYNLDSTMWVLIIDDDVERVPLRAAGTVTVTAP